MDSITTERRQTKKQNKTPTKEKEENKINDFTVAVNAVEISPTKQTQKIKMVTPVAESEVITTKYRSDTYVVHCAVPKILKPSMTIDLNKV